MKTLKTPFWPVDLTKKYWAKNKSSKVKKTGVGEKIAQAQALFSKIKWELLDPSKAKQRLGFKSVLDKVAAAQIKPLDDLISDIARLANNAANSDNADGGMIKLCDHMDACAITIAKDINNFVTDARANADEYDTSGQAYAKTLTDFIKDFTLDLKTLETAAKELSLKADKAAQYMKRASEQEGPEAVKTATLAKVEADGATKVGAALQTRRDTYRAKMNTARNITPSTYGLTTQDVQVHEKLILMTRRMFGHLDKTYVHIEEAVQRAEKYANDAVILIDQTKSNYAKWQKKIVSDIKRLMVIHNEMQSSTANNWGSQISQQGKVFDDTQASIKAATPENMKGVMGSAIKRVQDASTLMPKVRDLVTLRMDTLVKNCFEYKQAIPPAMRLVLSQQIGVMEGILKKAEELVTKFEKDYAISMKRLQLLQDFIKKQSK